VNQAPPAPHARAAEQIWACLDGNPASLARVEFRRTHELLPAIVPVTAAAAAAAATATLAIARLLPAGAPAVTVDGVHAVLAFRGERLLRVNGGPPPPVWDPLAGDYPAATGWVRLHTNYRHHRDAALSALSGLSALPALGVRVDRDAVAAAVARWDAVELEEAITAAGGCAAALRSRSEWRAHPQGMAIAERPLLEVRRQSGGEPEPLPAAVTRVGTWAGRPLGGVRVLDLTRVIAGPTAGRVLAAWGADVLRVDPPGFDEMPVLILEATTGKRTTALDLRRPPDRERFDALVRGADVLLTGYRPGAMAGLGYGPRRLAELRPGLVTATLSAYGTTGPWAGRRGFDSLVQLATGLADEARIAAGADHPVPLPAQALDYLTGWLLVTGIAEALRRRATDGGGWHVEATLARTAHWLDDLGRTDGLAIPEPGPEVTDPFMVELTGPLGRTAHVACPGAIGRHHPQWMTGPVPLGHHRPAW
jgi:CoA-transferase family III